MTSLGERIAARALALGGVPFRLYGRSAETGVDCVGLVLLSLRGAGMVVDDPPPYRLRAGDAPMTAGWMRRAGFAPGVGRQAGDLVLVRVSALQPHLLIDLGASVVHAHGGLGRVVEMALPAEWAELERWRAISTM